MPRVIIDLPYVPESNQIAQILAQQVTQTLPGAEVQIVDTSDQQPEGGAARGLSPALSSQRPLTNAPMGGQRSMNAPGPFGDYARKQALSSSPTGLPQPPRPPSLALPSPAQVQTSPSEAQRALAMQTTPPSMFRPTTRRRR